MKEPCARFAWVLLAMLSACKGTPVEPGSQPAKEPASSKPTAEKPAAVETPEVLTGSAEDPVADKPRASSTAVPENVAYVGVQGWGIVRVANGTSTTLVKNEHKIYELALDPHGILYATAIGGAWRIEGDKVTPLPESGAMGRYPQSIAVGADGVLWGIDYDGAYRLEGNAWKQFPRFSGTELLKDITVDAANRPWVATSTDLWRFDGTTWQRVDKKFAKDRTPYFETVVANGSTVYTSCLAGTFAFADEVWTKLPLKGRYGGSMSVDEIAAAPDGRLAVSGGIDEVAIVPPAGQPQMISLKKIGASEKQADVMAVDGSGRTWLRSDNGVIILDGDGKLAQQWKPGTVDGIKGEIDAIAVFGKGPTLPTLTAAARGIVVGKILHKGKPVGGAAIELCATPSMFMDKTPCSNAAVMRKGVTAADGTFTISDVPVGSYGVAVKPKRTWFVTWGNSDCCTALEDGGTFDMGALKLDELD